MMDFTSGSASGAERPWTALSDTANALENSDIAENILDTLFQFRTMSELQGLILCGSGLVLWRLGGTSLGHWPRRITWPLLVGIVLVHHSLWWQIVGCVGGLMLVNSLPYGEHLTWKHQEFDLHWPLRLLILTSLAVPSLFLSWHLWALRLALMGGLASLFFWLSRTFNRFSWLLVECQMGFLQALSIIVAI